MPITPTKKIWMDGKLVDWPDAKVHVLSHTLHYGTGAFEGIRAYKTPNGVAVFRLKDHMDRLLRSCKILMMEVPYDAKELCDAAKELIRVNELNDGCYIRPIVYLGYGEIGVNPIGAPVQTAIATWSWGAYLGDHADTGVKMKISSWSRHYPNSMPTASKTIGGYVNASLAKVEAVKAGYDEAIMLGPNDLGYDVNFEALRRDDLYLADEAFLTGTAAEVVPISSVDDRTVGDGKPGPITSVIRTTYHQTVRGERPQYEDWLDRV